MRFAVVVGIVLLVPSMTFAGQPADPRSNAQLGALRRDQPKDPYQQLFAVQQSLKGAVEQAATAPKTTIVCGMLIVPANPTLDPKMAVTPPQNPNLEYKIRVMAPPVCNAGR